MKLYYTTGLVTLLSTNLCNTNRDFFQQQKKIKHSKPNFSGTNCVGFCPWHLVLQRSLANRRQSSAEETFKMLFVPRAIIERTLGCHKDTASTVIVYLHDKKSSLCDQGTTKNGIQSRYKWVEKTTQIPRYNEVCFLMPFWEARSFTCFLPLFVNPVQIGF